MMMHHCVVCFPLMLRVAKGVVLQAKKRRRRAKRVQRPANGKERRAEAEHESEMMGKQTSTSTGNCRSC